MCSAREAQLNLLFSGSVRSLFSRIVELPLLFGARSNPQRAVREPASQR